MTKRRCSKLGTTALVARQEKDLVVLNSKFRVVLTKCVDDSAVFMCYVTLEHWQQTKIRHVKLSN